METTKMLTSLLVLTLTGPTLAYPFTRGVLSRGNDRARAASQVLDSGLNDYLDGYMQDQQYGLPEYQPAYRHYAPQKQRINAEALAALLPYLTNSNDDYSYDYNSYSDNDGTWYDDVANDDVSDSTDSDNAALLQFLLDHHTGRYSLEDLENLEKEAEMEDNTENQLHALMANKMINKKSSMPQLGSRPLAIASPYFQLKGQKEVALDIPSTSIRRPVFGRQITTQPEETEVQQKRNIETPVESSNIVQEGSESSHTSTSRSSSSTSDSDNSDSSTSSSSLQKPLEGAADQATQGSSQTASVPLVDSQPKEGQAPMTPFIQSKYDALMKYLDRERKVRQNQDIEQELQQEIKAQPRKRFVAEQDVLSEQLVNLKKKVA